MARKLTVILICIAVAFATSTALGSDWSIEADFAESCSCNPACPCMFGSPSTNEHCEGSRLVEIRKGRYGDVDLAGAKVVMTFRMGAWVKYYVDAEEDKVEVARDLVMAAFPGVAGWGTASTERARVNVERTGDTVRFSVPHAAVEIEAMKGKGGKVVRVENLASADNYVQYVSVKNSHESEQHGFEYSGTNGFTATVKAKGSSE